MIKIFPEYQFVVLAIVANRSLRGKFVYDLPENVVEVHELYLEDADWRPKELKRAARLKLNEREYAALRSLLMNQNVDWDTLFSFFGEKEFSLNELLMGRIFSGRCRNVIRCGMRGRCFLISSGRCAPCTFRCF